MPGLNRIILIDTHLNGVVELKLDSHTNICGTNASGKTTLQRLVPVFYGEYPSRVVPSTRDSFERWYLRHESSYIIYEYIRADQSLCQAVLSSSGKGVDYRFIGKGFELEDYTFALRGGERKIIAPVDLSRKMKRDGIACTRQLNTRDYRAIIQNDRSILNASRDLPNMAQLFSLAETGTNLRHIEKLAKAVHSKEGKMDTIRSMIAAILEEDGITPPVNTIKLNAVENWIKERKLIKGFEELRPQFIKLQQANDEYQSNNQRLAELKQQYAFDKSALDKSLIEEQSSLDEVILILRQLKRDWEEQNTALNYRLAEAKGSIQNLNENLEKLETTYDDWQEQGIDQLSENIQSLPGWKSELQSAESQLELLTNEHQDVEASYNKRLREISDQYNEELQAFDTEGLELREQLAEQKAKQSSQEAEISEKFLLQISEAKEQYQQRLAQLQNHHTEISTLLTNVGFTEQEQQQLDLLEAAVREAAEQEDFSREQLVKAEASRDAVKSQQQQAVILLEQAERSKQQKQLVVESVEALLYPGHNTLLEYLRREHPEWADTIGKVVNPELLARADLKPELLKGESLYGVGLDLASLELPEYASSEQSLQQKLETAQAERDEAVELSNEAEAKLSEINNELRGVELTVTKARTEASNAEQNRRRIQLDKESSLREFQQARSDRKQNYKKKLTENANQQAQVKAQQSEALQQIDDDKSEALLDCRSHWQMLVGDLELKIEQLDTHKIKAKQNNKQEKKQCDAWFKDELAKRDVDVDQIAKLKAKVEQLGKDIKETEKNRHKVSEYEHWYKVYYSDQKIGWQQQLTAAKKNEADASRELQQLQTDFQQNKSLNEGKQVRFEKQLKEYREQENELQNVVRLLGKIKLATVDLESQNTTLVQRISEGQQLLNKRSELQADIKAYVEHFDSQIAQQAGTGLSDIWDKSREECMYTNEHGIRNVDHIQLVAHLDQLLNIHVPQHLTTLKDTGRVFGKNLSEYYKVLREIEAHIGNQSKRISQAVDQELFLDGVSDSAVIIRSKISELDFWDELQQFSKHYEAWIADGATQLPSEEYAQCMRTVLDILGRSALEGGISKLLDIELHIHEGNSDLVIRTDRQLNESSSHGMAYLILCKFLLAFTRLLRGKSEAVIHWPIDELGTLHQTNIKKIFDACSNNNIRVLGAFPNPESEVLTLFDNRYLIAKKDGQRRLQVVQPKVSAIAASLEKAKQQQSSKNDVATVEIEA